MFTVYVLFSVTYHKIYIGFTSNPEARLASHNADKGKGYTHRFQPWKVVYSEQFTTKAEAQKREKELKSAKGREFVWNIIKSTSN